MIKSSFFIAFIVVAIILSIIAYACCKVAGEADEAEEEMIRNNEKF